MSSALSFQDLFQGFQNTPLLWNSINIYNFEQFCPKNTTEKFIEIKEHKKLRLGKWVERFVSFQLKQQSNIKILDENIQIKDHKITIGELDLLLLQDEQPIHVEIIYKFYLYDDSKTETNTLNHWVGPNQNDTLILKLNKLKEKQFPLLYRSQSKPLIANNDLDITSIKQQVCFKAQLFLPKNNQNIETTPLNSDCVVGWYLNIQEIEMLNDFQFYIPDKLEWLCSPKIDVAWVPFSEAFSIIQNQIKNKRSPLCWIKNSENELQKCFITWW